MPTRARLYVAAVTAAAVLTAVLVLPGLDWAAVDPYCFSLLIAFAVVLVFTTKVPVLDENPATPALVAVLLCAAILLPGPAAALVGVIGVIGLPLRGVPVSRVLFGMSCAWLSTIAACLAYRGLGGTYSLQAQNFPRSFLPIETAAVILSVVAAVLLALLPFSGGRASARTALLVGSRLVPRNVAYSFVGLLAAVLWDNGYNLLAALVLLGPVIVTRWATVQYEEQRTAHDAIIRTLVQAVEIKDLYTRGHSERVARISEMIADELRLPPERVEVLRYAATLHDVGKLGVPTRLLRKTGRLDDEEFEEIRLHPSRGVEVVRDIAFLDEAYSAILHHHERMDGLGYPSGLRGMRIPPFARIIAVADAFDSMTSTRSYRGARGSDEALNELRANMGSQFDPSIVDAIAAALSRAELAGHPWRGDGTASAGGRGGQPELAELPPGAVVAQFDHDDPAYQLLTVESEGEEKPQTDDFAPGPEPFAEELAETPEAEAESAEAEPEAEPKLRLGTFRPELSLPAQATRERPVERDAPTNTGPETEGR